MIQKSSEALQSALLVMWAEIVECSMLEENEKGRWGLQVGWELVNYEETSIRSSDVAELAELAGRPAKVSREAGMETASGSDIQRRIEAVG